MKQEKAARLSEITTEMIVAGGRIAEKVMLQLCQRILDGKGIPDEWKTNVVGSTTFRCDHFGTALFSASILCFLLTLTQSPNPNPK